MSAARPPEVTQLEAYLRREISCRSLVRAPKNVVSVEAAHRFVREWTSEGIRFEPNLERPPKGSFLDPAINRYFVALQTELLATEGWQ